MFKRKLQFNKQGNIALILVIMVTTLTLVSALTLALINISDLTANYHLLENENVTSQKDACLEEAMYRISQNVYATGTYALDLGDVFCNFEMSATVNGLKTVTTTAAALSSLGYWQGTVLAQVNVSSTPIELNSYKDLVSAAWDSTAWSKRMRISVPPSKVAGDLHSFPVYVNLADLGTDFFANVEADGSDIVVTFGDGTTKLPRELVDIDTVAKTGELHFLAPVLSSEVATDFYIYFGNIAATETNDNMWLTNYSLVQHLNNDPSGPAPQMVDSTGRGHHGTSNGAMLTEDLITAPVGKGLDFDDNDDSISIANPGNLGSDQGTISFWVNSPVHGQVFLSFYPAVNNDGAIFVGETSFPITEGDLIEVYDDGMVRVLNQIYYLSDPEKLGWHKMDWRQDGEGVDLFFDGQAVDLNDPNSNNSYWSGHFTASAVMIGRYVGQGPGAGLHKMDEVRISNKAFSAEWLATEYNNQFDSDTFYSTSTVESFGCSGVSMFGYCWYQASAVSMSCDQVCAANSLSCVSSVNYSDLTCSLNVALGTFGGGNCSVGCSDTTGVFLDYSPSNLTSSDVCLTNNNNPAYTCATPEPTGAFKMICACE
jgi:hypothetical protein